MARFAAYKAELRSSSQSKRRQVLREKQLEMVKALRRRVIGERLLPYTVQDKGEVPIRVLRKEIAICKTMIREAET